MDTAPLMTPKKSKSENLTPQGLMTAINKRFGPGTVTTASDTDLEITRLPTGILSLDHLLQGGFPRGRYTEIFGSAAVGKTYSTLKFIATCQEDGLRCAFVDVERTFDPEWAEHIGVDLEELAYHRQRQGAQVVDFIETLLRSNLYDTVVMDSVAALLPIEEHESSIQDSSFGTQQAKLMSKALRKLTAANSTTALIFINQVRDNVGTVFGKRQITSGGRALGHYSGLRIEMVKTENIKRNMTTVDPKSTNDKKTDVVVGHRVLCRVEKNKTGGPSQGDQSTFVFDYETSGADEVEDLIYVGRVMDLVHKKGDYFYVDGYEDEKQRGRTRFKKWLRRNKAVQEDLRDWILEDEE